MKRVRDVRDVHTMTNGWEMTMVNCGQGKDSENCPRDYKCVKNDKYGYAVCCKGTFRIFLH